MDRDTHRSVEVSRSLLPHSQILQAWVEGGALGIAFFGLYGWRLIGTIHWYVWKKLPDVLTPLSLFLVVSGFWSLLASPFLGIARIDIAMAVGAIAISIHERRMAARASLR